MKEISRGKTREQIENWYKNKYPDLSEKTMKSDLQDAFDQLISKQEIFNNYMRELLTERYDMLWELAIEKGDIKAATAILKQMTDLFGVNAPQKQEISIKDADFEISFK